MHKRELAGFLAEDIGRGDLTSMLLGKRRATARIISRQEAVIAGVRFARELFGIKGCKAVAARQDGSRILPGQTILRITGDVRNILSCERTALNLLARMSGIATRTDSLVSMIPKGVKLYSTRKTAPGLRYFDKEAVHIGGANRHRSRLDEMIMIKDNHIAAEGLAVLIKKAKRTGRRFEVEVEDTKSALYAAQNGAAIIMLDNFTPGQVRRTVTALKKKKLRGKVTLEASGNITQKNIRQYAGTGIDRISVGGITSSVQGVDLSLEILS